MLTRGKVMNSVQPDDLVKAVAALPDPELDERRLLLWAHPTWAAFVLVLLGVFWVGRKIAGAF